MIITQGCFVFFLENIMRNEMNSHFRWVEFVHYAVIPLNVEK